MNSTGLQRIFVYGTLKRGLSNSHYLYGQQFIDAVRTQPVYRMVNAGGYPGMYEAPDDGVSIQGEVWDVDDACSKQLDILEDVAVGLYELVPVALEPPYNDGSVVTYIYRWSIMGRGDAGDNWTED